VLASFYLRTGSAPVVRFACKHGRTQVGRYHASAALSLDPDAVARIVAMICPLEEGRLLVRAHVVAQDEQVHVTFATRVQTAGTLPARRAVRAG